MDHTSGANRVTRAHLAQWGFVRLPDVWLSCPSEGRRTYFERWYHAGWNFTAIIGWPGRDPLAMDAEDFMANVQAHMLGDEELAEYDPWDDFYQTG